MIEARANGTRYHVSGLANKGGYFGKTWLIGVGVGYSSFFYVVEAHSEQDAIDELVDSKHGHILKTDMLCEVCEAQEKILPEYRVYDDCECCFAGNYGERIDPSAIGLLKECKVNYFAKYDDELCYRGAITDE